MHQWDFQFYLTKLHTLLERTNASRRAASGTEASAHIPEKLLSFVLVFALSL